MNNKVPNHVPNVFKKHFPPPLINDVDVHTIPIRYSKIFNSQKIKYGLCDRSIMSNFICWKQTFGPLEDLLKKRGFDAIQGDKSCYYVVLERKNANWENHLLVKKT